MKTTHYVLVVWGCVESDVIGPFKTGKERDMKARELRNGDRGDDSYVGWLDVNAKGQPQAGDYSHAFMAGA